MSSSSIKSDNSLKLDSHPSKLDDNDKNLDDTNQLKPNEAMVDFSLENHHGVNGKFTEVDLTDDLPTTTLDNFEKKKSTFDF